MHYVPIQGVSRITVQAVGHSSESVISETVGESRVVRDT